MKQEKLSILFPRQDEVTYREIPEESWHDLGLDALTEKVATYVRSGLPPFCPPCWHCWIQTSLVLLHLLPQSLYFPHCLYSPS